MTPRERLERLRTGPRAELVTGVAFLLALPLGAVHWLGLVLGGVLVGVLAPTPRRAVVVAVYLGGTLAALFAGWLALSGDLNEAIATGQLFAASLALAIGLPVLGSGVRGLG